MKIGIIGGGMTGLSAAKYAVEQGHEVYIWEKNANLGGLAQGFKDENWQWSLEHHYHHIFQTDHDIISLAKSVNSPFKFYNTKTAIWHSEGIDPLDGVQSLITFPGLSLTAKLRMASALAYLKTSRNWQQFESVAAHDWIKNWMGEEIWKKIWEPLFVGKFADHAYDIGMVWFWARIHSRSQKLGYFDGGFQTLVAQVEKYLLGKKVQIEKNQTVTVTKNKKAFTVTTNTKTNYNCDRIILALSHKQVPQVYADFPQSYLDQLSSISGLGAMTLVMALKKELLPKNLYWLNVNQPAPFLAVVEHTHMINKENYGNDNLIYVGKYLSENDALYKLNEKELIQEYLPSLQVINPEFEQSWILKSWLFKSSWAQPLIKSNHGKKISSMHTPIPGMYWCSMEHVYPWDRGTNFAVQWGTNIAKQAIEGI